MGANIPSPNSSEATWWGGGKGKGGWSFQFIFINGLSGKVAPVRSAQNVA